jgi:hypothetical protein
VCLSTKLFLTFAQATIAPPPYARERPILRDRMVHDTCTIRLCGGKLTFTEWATGSKL